MAPVRQDRSAFSMAANIIHANYQPKSADRFIFLIQIHKKKALASKELREYDGFG
jgi:hypothetical protein